MIKTLVVRFRVEDVGLPALLSRLSLIHESSDSIEIEDFYVPCNSPVFDSFGYPSQRDVVRDPKPVWPVSD